MNSISIKHCNIFNQYAIYYYNSHGQLDRTDGPAIEYFSGRKEWYRNGMLHRLDGPAKKYDNSEFWFASGLEHRENAPAVITPHLKRWCKYGKLHRLDGPADEYTDGTKCYYLYGKASTYTEVLKHNLIRQLI